MMAPKSIPDIIFDGVASSSAKPMKIKRPIRISPETRHSTFQKYFFKNRASVISYTSCEFYKQHSGSQPQNCGYDRPNKYPYPLFAYQASVFGLLAFDQKYSKVNNKGHNADGIDNPT